MEKKRILVVEDEFSINDVLTYAFRKDGFEVRGVYTGADALEMVDSFKPHLVLLDLMLPDINGFDICKKISDKTFVVMVTARDEVIDKILGMEIGADDYVTKPFEVRE
ncbi:MAG: response regulator transcription factor, partial [Clostridium sp.]